MNKKDIFFVLNFIFFCKNEPNEAPIFIFLTCLITICFFENLVYLLTTFLTFLSCLNI